MENNQNNSNKNNNNNNRRSGGFFTYLIFFMLLILLAISVELSFLKNLKIQIARRTMSIKKIRYVKNPPDLLFLLLLLLFLFELF